MNYADAIDFIPTYVMAFFRLAGLMIMSPLFGSARIPGRMKVLFASVATLGMMTAFKTPITFPQTLGALTVGLAGEFAFGLAMGMMASFAFIAAQWAGEIIGQQVGFSLSQVFDPQFGQGGTLIGDLYFMLTLVIFLVINGHRTLIHAVHESFATVPLLTLGLNENIFFSVVFLLKSATILAMQLAAPVFCTMLVVDMSMGVIGKAMPQFNIMSAGAPMKLVIGLIVLAVGVGLTTETLTGGIEYNLGFVREMWPTGGQPDGR